MDPSRYSASEVANLFSQLKLKAIAECFEERYQAAVVEGVGMLEFLGSLLDEEGLGRGRRRFERLVKSGNLFLSDSIENYDFDLARKHGVDPAMVRDLAGCDFVRNRRNVILAGAVGTGKTRLARLLAYEAIRRDFRAVFENTRELVEKLHSTRDSYHFGKIYRQYVTAPLLAIDDLAYMPFAPEKVEFLFRLVHDRIEKKTGSLIITTNTDVKEWWSFFPSKAMGMAFSDRALGGAIGIKFTGKSIRTLPDSPDTTTE
jgi:DNA replication protein DnaC